MLWGVFNLKFSGRAVWNSCEQLSVCVALQAFSLIIFSCCVQKHENFFFSRRQTFFNTWNDTSMTSRREILRTDSAKTTEAAWFINLFSPSCWVCLYPWTCWTWPEEKHLIWSRQLSPRCFQLEQLDAWLTWPPTRWTRPKSDYRWGTDLTRLSNFVSTKFKTNLKCFSK